jgi:hypothetical protein
MSTDFVVARGQQVVSLLLSTVPLAERMLLYNVALTAWIMLPERGLLQKSFSYPVFKGRGWGRVPQVRQPAPACRGSVPGPTKMGGALPPLSAN